MNFSFRILIAILVTPLFSTPLFAPIDRAKIRSLISDKPNLIPVAIIGGGPTGLSAAIPLARSGYQTVVFQGAKPGGELADAQIVENWPAVPKMSGASAMGILERQAREFGTQLVPLVVENVEVTSWPYKISLNNGTHVYALTIIIATGSTQRMLGVEGEQRYWGKGVFSCGLCDGHYARGKRAVIVGGGDIAIQRALQLLPESQHVTLIVPGTDMTAHESMQEKIKGQPTISVIYSKEIKEIVGDENEITSVLLKDTTTDETSSLPTSCVFLSTGLTPNTELFKNKISIDDNGCIMLKQCTKSQNTEIEGIMAAGTVSDNLYRQIATISGEGTKAGMDALAWLSKWGFDSTLRPLLNQNKYIPPIIPHPLIKHITTLRELKSALKDQKPILLEIYSPGCPSCRKMEGPLTSLAEQYKTGITIYKIDKDKLYSPIELYNINLIPAFLLLKNGKEIARLEGESNLTQLRELIRRGLEKLQVPRTS
jgi:thioredoxin reductase (NADPH)